MADYGTKTLNEYDTFNPIRNLWRNVLVVAISDAIKIKSRVLQFSSFYKNKKFYEIDYVTLPNRDFDSVCNMCDLDGNLVRKKINRSDNPHLKTLMKVGDYYIWFRAIMGMIMLAILLYILSKAHK